MQIRSNVCRAGLWLSGLLLMAAGSAHAAVASAHSGVAYEDVPGNGSLVNLDGTPGPISTVSFTSTTGLAAAGFGQSAFGALHASASAISNGESARIFAMGGPFWIDQITFFSSQLSGPAYARASFSLSGGLSAQSQAGGVDGGAVARSSIAAVVQVNGSSVFSANGDRMSRNGAIEVDESTVGIATNGSFSIDPANSVVGVFTFDIPFVFNTPFQLFGSITAGAQALTSFGGDQASAFSNFSSSAYWGGISEVHLADGTALTGYTVASDSGFDWASAYPAPAPAVPEPASVMLMSIGLAGLAAWRRASRADPKG